MSVNLLKEYIKNILKEESQYKIERQPELLGINLLKIPQLAYAASVDKKLILIGRSGHGKLVRGDRRGWTGGWLFPKQGKIVLFSGLLGHTSEDIQNVIPALESEVGTNFMVAESKDYNITEKALKKAGAYEYNEKGLMLGNPDGKMVPKFIRQKIKKYLRNMGLSPNEK